MQAPHSKQIKKVNFCNAWRRPLLFTIRSTSIITKKEKNIDRISWIELPGKKFRSQPGREEEAQKKCNFQELFVTRDKGIHTRVGTTVSELVNY